MAKGLNTEGKERAREPRKATIMIYRCLVENSLDENIYFSIVSFFVFGHVSN